MPEFYKNSTNQTSTWESIKRGVRLLMLPCLVLACGCDGPSVTDAVPRSSSNKLVLASDLEKTEVSEKSTAFNYLNSDHFMCLSVEVQPVISNKQLSDVDWSELSKQLENILGAGNASLKSIDRISLIIDREDVNLAALTAPRSRKNPLLVMFEYNQSVVGDDLEVCNQSVIDSRKGKSRRNLPPLMIGKQLGENRIVYGKDQLIEKVVVESRLAPMATTINSLSGENEVVGVFEFGPIREQIQGLYGMLTAIPGTGMEAYSQLPDVAERIDLQFSLSNKELMTANFFLDDEELIKTFSSTLNDLLMADSTGMASAFSGRDNDIKLMFTPESTEIIPDILEQIREDGLMNVTGDVEKLTLKLKRPERFDELVKSIVHDATHQIQLAQRTASLSKIGLGLKEFEKKNEGLAKLEEPDSSFSWRVQLLPHMGYQELYDRFNLEEPWDSADNLKVAEDIPAEFAAEKGSTETSFHLADGKMAIGLAESASEENAESPEAAHLFYLVEGQPTVPWTKPGGAVALTEETAAELGQDNEQGVLVLDGKFQVKTISKESPADFIQLPTGR